MTPIIFGNHDDIERSRYADLLDSAYVYETVGDWIKCPTCDSECAVLVYWEKSDFGFDCPECDAREIIR